MRSSHYLVLFMVCSGYLFLSAQNNTKPLADIGIDSYKRILIQHKQSASILVATNMLADKSINS